MDVFTVELKRLIATDRILEKLISKTMPYLPLIYFFDFEEKHKLVILNLIYVYRPRHQIASHNQANETGNDRKKNGH